MNKCLGIVLAGGLGTRMNPVTSIINKHFLPIYNKPMIYYPISILIYAGIKNILIICNPNDIEMMKKTVESINQDYNVKFIFKIQKNSTGGIAESLIIGKEIIKNYNKTCLVLGDNFFWGKNFPQLLRKKIKNEKNCIFLCPVINPNQYGIAEIKKDKIVKLVEKPKKPKSNWAITGLYIYNTKDIDVISKLKRSKRGELEITHLNSLLLKTKKLSFQYLGRGITWFDMGTFSDLHAVAAFVKVIEEKQGYKISDLTHCN